MKRFLAVLMLIGFLSGCSASKKADRTSSSQKNHEVPAIANDSSSYDIIILERGFQAFLTTQPKPGHYTEAYLKAQNKSAVAAYNSRVGNADYEARLYPRKIDYDPAIDYGFGVDYRLYNYFLYFEKKYGQKL